jgi:hypothetical protein
LKDDASNGLFSFSCGFKPAYLCHIDDHIQIRKLMKQGFPYTYVFHQEMILFFANEKIKQSRVAPEEIEVTYQGETFRLFPPPK